MRALVLSGGGAKGAYQVGVLKHWLLEQKTEYDILAGISVGALNAAYLAQFSKQNTQLSYEELDKLWGRVSPGAIKKNWFPFSVLESLWKPSVYNTEPLRKWVRDELSVKLIEKSKRELRVVAVSWDTGEARVATQDTLRLADWVLASAAFPVMFEPIEINGELWSDGGLRSVTPLGEAIKAGATEIDVIMCSDPYARSPFKSKDKSAIPDFLLRTLDIMSDEIMRADLKICGLKNDLVTLNSKYRKVTIDRVVAPSQDVGDSLDFSQAGIQKLKELGYQNARRVG